jgi:hypothetical protein
MHGRLLNRLEPEEDPKAALESLPRLCTQVCAMWGEPGLDDFISELIMDSRDGTRQGLPMDAAAELFFLAQMLKSIRVLDIAKQEGIDFSQACKLVYEAEQRDLKAGIYDDSQVAQDMTAREKRERRDGQRPPPVYARQTADSDGGNVWLALLRFIASLLLNRLLLALLGAILFIKFAWPHLRQVFSH